MDKAAKFDSMEKMTQWDDPVVAELKKVSEKLDKVLDWLRYMAKP